MANDALIPRLKAEGYTQSKYVPGLFTHANNTVQFCLTVDDFRVKSINKADDTYVTRSRETTKSQKIGTEPIIVD